MAVVDDPVEEGFGDDGVGEQRVPVLRRGQVYGTVLVDITAGAAIELPPDREAGTLESWLKAHPGAQVICRDRAGQYAEGARDGAPDAIQVADRWHLWHNLAGHAEKTVVAHRACLKDQHPAPGDAAGQLPGPDPAAAAPAAPCPPPAEPDGLRDVCGRERRLVTRTRERHAAIWDLLAAGQSLGAISRELGLDRHTVRRFTREPDVDKLLVKATSRDSKLDPFKPWINQRWNDGTAAAALTPACRPRAGPAACRPCTATSAHSGHCQLRRPPHRPYPRPARSPAAVPPGQPGPR